MKGTFGKVNAFLHSSLELQLKRSDHFINKFLATPFHAQMTSKLLNMGLVACLRGHRASDALSLLRSAERGGPQLQLDFFRTRGTGGTWHSDVGFSIQQLVVLCWLLGLVVNSQCGGYSKLIGVFCAFIFFHRRGKILNNWDSDPAQFWCFCEVLARAELGELLCYHECPGTRISSFCRRSSDFHRRMAVCTGAVRGVARTTPWSNNSEAWWKINEQRENMEGIVAT